MFFHILDPYLEIIKSKKVKIIFLLYFIYFVNYWLHYIGYVVLLILLCFCLFFQSIVLRTTVVVMLLAVLAVMEISSLFWVFWLWLWLTYHCESFLLQFAYFFLLELTSLDWWIRRWAWTSLSLSLYLLLLVLRFVLSAFFISLTFRSVPSSSLITSFSFVRSFPIFSSWMISFFLFFSFDIWFNWFSIFLRLLCNWSGFFLHNHFRCLFNFFFFNGLRLFLFNGFRLRLRSRWWGRWLSFHRFLDLRLWYRGNNIINEFINNFFLIYNISKLFLPIFLNISVQTFLQFSIISKVFQSISNRRDGLIQRGIVGVILFKGIP